MIHDDPNAIPERIALFKAGLDLAKFLVSERLGATVENVRGFFARHPSPLGKQFESEEGLTSIKALMVIDPKVLRGLSGAVDDAIEEYDRCLRQSKSPTQRDGCDRVACRSVCEHLNRIRDRNAGVLPDTLSGPWQSFNCERF